ncbi:amino acid ABC transporter ATP-binding protein [Streptomyces sp. MN03-5084-2B]|nr:amino acid ABC transporter ATP-binding protein [Streptomyces sp. MN03-5084-2B]
MTAPMVEIVGVHKSYGTNRVLDGVDLTVARGEAQVLIGPSGAGKSTLLRVINHLEKADRGIVRVDGELIGYRRTGDRLRELPERHVLRQRTGIGFVFQDFNLFANLTVLENVAEAPISGQGRPRDEVYPMALRLLDRVGLAHKAGEHPRRLSGGQQQRVAIARALALEPKLLLFDEPTSALDPELVGEVLEVMRSLASAGTTMVVVTHEMSFARDVADTVVFMADGRVVERGTPAEVLERPRHDRTKAFLAKIR